MMEEIEKISDNPNLSNEGAYTGDNAYTVEVGMQIKTRELQLKDYTSTGWYVKSVGVDELPTSIKNQLFDINVANALDGDAVVEYTFDNGAWKTNETDENRGRIIDVVGKIKGQFFLRNTTRIKGNPVESDLLLEEGDKYYIVSVEDAIKSKNLNKANYTGANAGELDKLENYINEIVQIVADNETYKTLSKKHWLEEMNIEYHDQKCTTSSKNLSQNCSKTTKLNQIRRPNKSPFLCYDIYEKEGECLWKKIFFVKLLMEIFHATNFMKM